jgi:hypothetical protein
MLENDLAKLREKGVDARVASGGGRMYVTMDRYEVKPSVFFCFFIISWPPKCDLLYHFV